jgi:hypothetical protein
MAGMLIKLSFKAFEKREGIRRAARKSSQHAAVVQPAHLAGPMLDDDVAQGYLTISAKRHLIAPAHRDDGCSVKLFHPGIVLGASRVDGPQGACYTRMRDLIRPLF